MICLRVGSEAPLAQQLRLTFERNRNFAMKIYVLEIILAELGGLNRMPHEHKLGGCELRRARS